MNAVPVAEAELTQQIDRQIDQKLNVLVSGMVMREEFERRIAEIESRNNLTISRMIAERMVQVEQQLDGKITTITNKVDQMLDRLGTWMNLADEKIAARTGEVSLIRQDVTKAEGAIERVSELQARDTARISALTTTIHGDPNLPEGPPSLFRVLHEVKVELTTHNTQFSTVIEQHTVQINSFAEERSRQREKWARRKQLCVSVAGWFLKTKQGQAFVFVLMLVALAIFAPELAVRLRQLLIP